MSYVKNQELSLYRKSKKQGHAKVWDVPSASSLWSPPTKNSNASPEAEEVELSQHWVVSQARNLLSTLTVGTWSLRMEVSSLSEAAAQSLTHNKLWAPHLPWRLWHQRTPLHQVVCVPRAQPALHFTAFLESLPSPSSQCCSMQAATLHPAANVCLRQILIQTKLQG